MVHGREAEISEKNEAETDEVVDSLRSAQISQAHRKSIPKNTTDDDTEARLEALAHERATLKDQVAELRQSLEEIQQKHEKDVDTLRGQLKERNGEKEQAETQYRNLLGKVNTIRSQLGERLKADAVGLAVWLTQTPVLILEKGRFGSSQRSDRGTRRAV